MSKSQFKKVPLDKIVEGRNVRLPQNMNVPELGADIAVHGLQTRLLVIAVKGGELEVISGHRRRRSIHWVKINNPKAYQKWFAGDQVEVEVVTGISYAEAQFLKIDHGNEQPLRGLELQNCANMLFDYELTEKEVVVRLATLLDRLIPMKSNKRKKLEEMRANLAALQVKGDTKNADIQERAILDFIFEYRRGVCQNLHNAYRCPEIVMAALYFKETAEYPEGVKKSVALPSRITTADVTKLYKAFKEDLEQVDAKGARKFNQKLPGPVFNAKWKDVLQDSEDKENAKSGTRAKSKSHKDLMKEAGEKWNSSGFQMLTQFHANEDIEMALLKQEDALLFAAEVLSERAPKEWGDILLLMEDLVKGAAAEANEVEAQKAASNK